MDKTYLSQLPDDIVSMVLEIELYIEDEIKIKIDDSREGKLACEVDKAGASILLPEANYFPDASVMHELFHIRRFCLQKVPRIKVCDSYDEWNPEIETGLTKLDNTLEHLIILPEEFILRPERINYWKSRINNALDNFDSTSLIRDDQERIALEYWVFTRLVISEDKLVKKAKSLIERLDIKDRAYEFFHAIKDSINSKEQLVKVCFKHLRLPLKIGCLEYIDCKNNKCHEKPLVAVSY